jgi:hypothetical protein
MPKPTQETINPEEVETERFGRELGSLALRLKKGGEPIKFKGRLVVAMPTIGNRKVQP